MRAHRLNVELAPCVQQRSLVVISLWYSVTETYLALAKHIFECFTSWGLNTSPSTYNKKENVVLTLRSLFSASVACSLHILQSAFRPAPVSVALVSGTWG